MAGSDLRPDREEITTTLSRLTITVSVVAYLVVFVVALQMGSTSDEALIKGGAAMLTIGFLGWIALSIVGHNPDTETQVDPTGSRLGDTFAFETPERPKGDEKR